MNATELPVSAPALPTVIKGRHYTSSHHGLDLVGTIYQDCHFDRLTWSGCNLSNLRFVNCRFDANRFERCELTNLVYDGCNVAAGEWTDCVLRGVSLFGGEIRDSVWSRNLLRDVIFAQTSGAALRFYAVRAAHVSFIASELAGVELNGGRWSDVSCISLRLSDLCVHAAGLENFVVGQSQCTECLLDACTGINVRWIDSQIERMTVRACDLKQAAWSHSAWTDGEIAVSRLPLAAFDHAKLSNLSMRDVELPQAIFDHASVEDSDLHGLHAPRIAFRHARLARVQLAAAQLTGLDARGATLDRVGLNGADCRSGLLTGQQRHAWIAADTRQATFDEAAMDDDRQWRQRAQPGARGE
ncbi:pentapeptide repeat-containing protein [Burkholderia stagnalis]|uniref:pentapeptide repeat-containing protein n=1 Tax=Burkholderia stagnalis TaxID=1503054 RepID=UPI000F8138F2|nr:pentapeptide repeat-containing protein [Burkholderia stagnalis]